MPDDKKDKSVKERVYGILKDYLEQGELIEAELTDKTELIDLGMDSLDIVELVLDLEDEFDIAADGNEYKKAKTVGDIVNYVEKIYK